MGSQEPVSIDPSPPPPLGFALQQYRVFERRALVPGGLGQEICGAADENAACFGCRDRAGLTETWPRSFSNGADLARLPLPSDLFPVAT